MKSKPLGCLIEVVETLVLTVVIFWLVQTFVAQPYRVEQSSMHGTLEQDEYVLVDKLTLNFAGYSRGDIIVFVPISREGGCENEPAEAWDPTDPPFIKRVIGLPGDTVSLVNSHVEVNGVALDEPYIHGRRSAAQGGTDSWTVPADRLFVMGDNRPESQDSRTFGPICRRDVIGKAFLRYWPIHTFSLLQAPSYPDVPPANETGGLQPSFGPITQRSMSRP